MPKVTGYKLRERIKYYELRLLTLIPAFKASLKAFPGEKTEDPIMLGKQVAECESAVAELQTVQAAYNLMVMIENKEVCPKGKISLCKMVKSLGGAGRLEKLWREAAKGKQTGDRWDSDRRNKDDEFATPTIKLEVALNNASLTAQYAGALRAAIAEANSVAVDIPVSEELLRN